MANVMVARFFSINISSGIFGLTAWQSKSFGGVFAIYEWISANKTGFPNPIRKKMLKCATKAWLVRNNSPKIVARNK